MQEKTYYLTPKERDKARSQAVKRLQDNFPKPDRGDFEIDYGYRFFSISNLPSIVAILVFVGAWLVSTLRILIFVGNEAAITYSSRTADFVGFLPDLAQFSVTTQIGFILLSEFSVLLFTMLFRRVQEKLWKAVFVGLAVFSGFFAVYCNLQVDSNILFALLPPVVVMGLGLFLEMEISEALIRREGTTARYMEAVRIYEQAKLNPEVHRDFLRYYTQQLFFYLQAKHQKQGLSPAESTLWDLVDRELSIDNLQLPAGNEVKQLPSPDSPKGKATTK